MSSSEQILFDSLKKYAIAKGQTVTSERIQIYVETLRKYDTRKVLDALGVLYINNKFFPDISEIVSLVVKSNTKGVDAADRIIGAIKSFGRYGFEDAKKDLEELWPLVEFAGGWIKLCNTPESSLGFLSKRINNKAKELGLDTEEIDTAIEQESKPMTYIDHVSNHYD